MVDTSGVGDVGAESEAIITESPRDDKGGDAGAGAMGGMGGMGGMPGMM